MNDQPITVYDMLAEARQVIRDLLADDSVVAAAEPLLIKRARKAVGA